MASTGVAALPHTPPEVVNDSRKASTTTSGNSKIYPTKLSENKKPQVPTHYPFVKLKTHDGGPPVTPAVVLKGCF